MKDYLGDAVYAEFDGFNIVLTTEDGITASNTIALEPSVVDAFLRFMERVNEMRQRAVEGQK